MAKCFPLLPVSEKPVKGVRVVGPIWSGGINVSGSLSIKLDGMEVFMPKTSYSKVFKVKQSLQPSLCFSMKNKHSVWPEHFDELGAAHHDIGLFMLPEISRSETAYDELVEYMISDDLAMTSHMGKIQLIIFTSLELEENQQQNQGKYYLWGMFKGKEFQNYKSSEGKKTSAKKRRISKCIRIEDGLIPLLSPGCKRIRSNNRRRMSTTINKEARNVQVENVCNTTVGKTKTIIVTDEQNACGVDDRFTNQVAGRQSSDSNMEIDEPSASSGINNIEGTKVVEHASRDIIMEIDDHSDDAVKELQPQSNVGLETDPKIKTCLTTFLNSKELPVSEVPNPAVIVERDSCSDGSPNKDMILRLNECSTITGCVGLQPLIDVSQESDLRIKTCLTPFVNSNELPVSEVPTLIINEERDLCSDVNPDCKLCDNVNISNQNDAENMILILNEGSTGNGLTVAAPMVLTDPKNSCLINLLDYKEELDIEEADLGVRGKDDSLMNEKPPRTYPNNVADDHQKIVEDLIPGMPELSAVNTDPENFSCSVLIHYKEESDVKEAHPLLHEEINLCLDQKSLGDHSNSVADDHPKFILDTVPGLDQLALKVDQPECRVADRLHELDSCTTPLVNYEEQSRPSSISSATIGLEADEVEHEEELEEGEIPTKAPKIFNEESKVITTSSMLKIVGDFHETTSNIVRVQVGRYTIKSDLAPFLTKILDNYGDIAVACSIMAEVLLEEICKTFQDLETVTFSGLRCHHLEHLKHMCQLGEALEIDMKWLSKRCDDLEKTALQISQYPFLKKEMDQCSKAIRSLEEKARACVVELLEDKQSIEKELVSLKERQKQLHDETKRLKSETSRFIGKSLMDVLIQP